MQIISLWVLLLFVLDVNAQSDNIFKVITNEGEIIYTDKPLGNIKPIELPKGSMMASKSMTNPRYP